MPQDAQQQQAATAPAPSQTITEPSQTSSQGQAPRVLRLRGARNTAARSVQWADDVVDNEGLGRKSSKVCCIYHKPKPVDESSDESSSSDSSDVDSDAGDGAKPVGGGKGRDCGHSHGRGRRHGHGKKPDGERRDPSPNAYEKVPKQKPRDGGASGK